jgi:DNA-binding NtrC family response regulator
LKEGKLMKRTGATPKIALLCHLEPSLEQELKAALAHPSIHMDTVPCQDTGFVQSSANHAGVVFCPFSRDLATLLEATKDSRIPVIVVTRTPETREWLDAMEAGAFDYCSAPFEPRQLQWILNSARPRTLSAA